MKREGFRHSGEVVAVDEDGVVSVSINRVAACDGCHAKGHCTVSAEGEINGERTMKVVNRGTEIFAVGDKVEVSITYRVGVIAVVMAYITPLVLFIASLVVAIHLGVDQGLSAGIAFVVSALYYCGVYFFRERFERVIDFELHRIE